MRSLTITLARAAALGLALAALLAVLAPARGLAQTSTRPAAPTRSTTTRRSRPTRPSSGARSATGRRATSGRDLTADIYKYFDAVQAATAEQPARADAQEVVRQVRARQDLQFYVLSTPDNIANLDGGPQ